MNDLQKKLGHPAFILCIFILVINDWYLKQTYHNEITGKLSDFAGLISFPYFLSALFPKNKKVIHVLTALLFIYWKSCSSQPLIDLFHAIDIPINRTIDPSDTLALISILISYSLLQSGKIYTVKPLLIKGIMIVSVLGFMATTLPPGDIRKFERIDKKYSFNISKRHLISRLNMIQIKEVNEYNKYSGDIDFDSHSNVFHFHGRNDTLALLLDYEKIKDQDTISFRTSYVQIIIEGNDDTSALKLISVFRFVPLHRKKDFREKAIKQFEKRVIKKIKNYGNRLYISRFDKK